jgi:hypothetical protein
MRPKRPTGTWPPRERSSTALAPRTGGAVQIYILLVTLLGAGGDASGCGVAPSRE